jgi:UDP-N-acetylmuramoylalanine--D-glutamate ligase
VSRAPATSSTIDPAGLTPAAFDAGVLRGRRVAVLGLARSGTALARFLVDAGAVVTVYDARSVDDLSDATEALGGRPVRLILGPELDPRTAWADAALVTTSPSINPDFPTTEPRLRAALRDLHERRSAGDPGAPAIVSEVDLFLRLCPAATVGVTGTKGKTTTSALTHALLAVDAEHPAVVGGNIGTPLIERIPELTPRHRVVVELSELQLPTLSRGTTVAVYTNVTADHLDRHGSLEAYRAVKRRLAELVEPDGLLVLNADDPVVSTYGDATEATSISYRLGPPSPGGVGLVDDWIVAAGVPRIALAGGGVADADGGRILPVGDLAIPGRHNVANAMAAIAAALAFGVEPAAIRAATSAFRGVEHRLEPAGEIDGVRYVNDSMATQPEAVAAALRSFGPPIVLIAGGRDKGVDLSGLAPVVAEHAIAAVLIGESGPDLGRRFTAAGLGRTERAGSLEAAVRLADGIARSAIADRPGTTATVLLSPAAASFDMFEDYAARGRAFKAVVAELAAEHARAAEGDSAAARGGHR